MKFFFILMYLLFLVGTSSAQTATPTPTPTIRETVTVSADSEQSIEQVSKTVNTILGQEMRERADYALIESVRTIPGFRIQQLGGFGRSASIKTRGLRNWDTAVLLDGVRFRDPTAINGDASPFLSDLTLTSVSKVEVLRGSGSSLYGTNAIGGVLDLQTPIPQSGWHGQASGVGGGLGLSRFRGNVSYGTSDRKFGFNAAISRTDVRNGIDGNDEADNTNFQSRIELNPTEKTNISLRFFASDTFTRLNVSPETFGSLPPQNDVIIDAVEGVTFLADAEDPDNRQNNDFFNGQVAITQAIGNEVVIQGRYSGLSSFRGLADGILGPGFQSPFESDYDGVIHTADGKFIWTRGPSKLSAAYEFEVERYRNEGRTPDGSGNFFTNAKQSSHTFFVQELLNLVDGKLQLAGGFRVQSFTLETPEFSLENAPYSDVVLDNPLTAYTVDAAASYYFPSTGTKIRAHVGNGYRVPSLYERFGTFFSTFGKVAEFIALGDPGLKPDRSVAFDVGVEQDLLDGKTRFSAVYFYTKLIDTVNFANVVPPIGNTQRPFGGYLNTEGGTARGAEVFGTVKPHDTFDLFVSYTYTDSIQNVPTVAGSGILTTMGIPKHQFTANVTKRFGRAWINFDLLAAGSYLSPIFSNDIFATYVYRFDGNRRGDLTGGYTFRFDQGKYNLRVFGTVENIFDNEYFENGFRTVGITGRAGASLSF